MIARDGVLDFDSMQTRLHPAESRVRKLSAEIPAEFIVFDVLLWDGEAGARAAARGAARRVGAAARVSTLADDGATSARRAEWLDSFEAAGLDGVIAKKLGLPYLPGSRDGVLKVKPHKTADCVIVGVRWKEKPTRIATLLLGLYGEGGKLDYVGSAAVAAQQAQRDLRPHRAAAEGRARARASRSPTAGAAASCRSRQCDRSSSPRCATTRCRATASATARSFIRFRDDKDPEQCTWREVRPPRRKGDPTFESLLGV